MSDLLEYKGYCGTVGYMSDGDILIGKVLGIVEKLSYTGDGVDSLRKNFEGVIDGYLGECARRNEKPQKPYRGIFNVRVSPELHRTYRSVYGG